VIADDASVEVDELLDVPVDAAEPPPPPQAVTICDRPIVATSDCRRLRFFFFCKTNIKLGSFTKPKVTLRFRNYI
jgi:hypothetical protein